MALLVGKLCAATWLVSVALPGGSLVSVGLTGASPGPLASHAHVLLNVRNLQGANA